MAVCRTCREERPIKDELCERCWQQLEGRWKKEWQREADKRDRYSPGSLGYHDAEARMVTLSSLLTAIPAFP